ncbi:MAG TPA: FmdB family transcriptional regulator [Candidatus Atribacteria bacterium]|nr:FmdB family transcriptional regulator [Candidatus Atribacteria bacterium]
MPIYEFLCNECGNEFEELVFGSDSQIVCDKCKSPKIEKLMSAVSFKSGSGFTPASGSSGCSSCAGKSCSTCK